MRNAPLYEQIASRIERQIRSGVLRPGERVPSVRRLSTLEKVSVTTILEAYMYLERRELIEAKPQSGYYVRQAPQELPPEPTIVEPPLEARDVVIADLVASIFAAAGDPAVVPFGTACAAPDFLPLTRLNRLYRDIIKDKPEHSANYDYAPGNLELRRQIARHARASGALLSADDIVITCGALEALTLALRTVTQAGDAVIVECPTYFGILQVLESLRLTAVEIAAHPRTGIDPDAVASALKRHSEIRAAVLMPSFHNPLGCLMPDEAKKELAALFRRHKVPLIEDDVYGDLSHGPVRPPTIKKWDEDGNVLLCSSFSKTLSPGMRIGWAAPGRYRQQLLQLKRMSTVASPSLQSLMLSRYFEGEGYERHLRRLRSALALQILRAVQAVPQHFPEGTKVSRPQGGFVLWVELPEKIDTHQLFRRALKRRIAFSPGIIFSASKSHRNFLRLNCGLRWDDRAEEAIVELGTLAKAMA